MNSILATATDNSDAAVGAGLVLFLIFLFWGAPIIAGFFIGKNKARTAAGILLPFFLGWLGVIIIACLSSDHQHITQVNVVTNPSVYNPVQPFPQGKPLPPPTGR